MAQVDDYDTHDDVAWFRDELRQRDRRIAEFQSELDKAKDVLRRFDGYVETVRTIVGKAQKRTGDAMPPTISTTTSTAHRRNPPYERGLRRADTNFWVALTNLNDLWHSVARAAAHELAPRHMVTTLPRRTGPSVPRGRYAAHPVNSARRGGGPSDPRRARLLREPAGQGVQSHRLYFHDLHARSRPHGRPHQR